MYLSVVENKTLLGMAVNNEILYEQDDKGQWVVVRSVDSTKKAYIRFTNRTSRQVDIHWRDFRGSKRQYVRLVPGAHYDINTFLTHPWEFRDAATHERYVVNNKYVFRAPPELAGMNYRTNWNITVTVRTLRHAAMLTLATYVPTAPAAETLGLPHVLEQELKEMVAKIHRPPFNDKRIYKRPE